MRRLRRATIDERGVPEPARLEWLRKHLLTPLTGLDVRDWWRLLRDNGFAVDPPYIPRAALITAISLETTRARLREERIFGAAIARADIAPPLFVLGHWRSGTTLLHYLLALDDRFAYPNLYQAWHPHTFLSTESSRAKLAGWALRRSRPMDGVSLSVHTATEDEEALLRLSQASPYLGLVFPRQREHYRRYLTMREASDEERTRWQAALVHFLRKLTLRYQRPLVLKSPAHTGRIRLLLRLFPEARFVHICRDPFVVYRSTCAMRARVMPYASLQTRYASSIEVEVIDDYRELYAAYFEEKDSIPAGRLHEIRFEDLERDPLATLSETYAALGLVWSGQLESRLRRYLDTQGAYVRNRYSELEPGLRRRLAKSWRQSFEAWDYPR